MASAARRRCRVRRGTRSADPPGPLDAGQLSRRARGRLLRERRRARRADRCVWRVDARPRRSADPQPIRCSRRAPPGCGASCCDDSSTTRGVSTPSRSSSKSAAPTWWRSRSTRRKASPRLAGATITIRDEPPMRRARTRSSCAARSRPKRCRLTGEAGPRFHRPNADPRRYPDRAWPRARVAATIQNRRR